MQRTTPPLSATLSLATFIAGLGTALVSFLPIRDSITWWHLAMGEIIARFNAVPMANRITFAIKEDTPSVIHAWLGELAMHNINSSIGVEGLLSIRNLIYFACMVAILTIPRNLTLKQRALIAILPAGLIACGLFTTPAMLAMPLFVLVLGGIYLTPRLKSKPLTMLAFLLPVAASALWVNIDISYGIVPILTLFGLLQCSFYEEDLPHNKQLYQAGWGLSAIASLGAMILANPRGLDLIPHTIKVLTTYPMHPELPTFQGMLTGDVTLIALFMSILLFSAVTQGRKGALEFNRIVIIAPVGAMLFATHHVAMALLIAMLLTVVITSQKLSSKQHIPLEFLYITLTILAMTHLRALVWLGLSVPILLDMSTSRGLIIPQKLDYSNKLPHLELTSLKSKLSLTLGGLALILLTQPIFLWRAGLVEPLAGVMNLRTTAPHQYSISKDVPVEVVEIIRNSGSSPRMWTSKNYENFVLYKLLPQQVKPLTLTDPRVEMFPPETLALRDLIRKDKSLWRGVFQGYDIRAALLDHTQDPDLVKALTEDPSWHLMQHIDNTYYFVLVRAVKTL